MPELLNSTTSFFINWVAPTLLGRKVKVDPERSRELERRALEEVQARVNRGRPGPEEWRRGASAPDPPPAAQVRVPAQLRPVAVEIALPLPARTPVSPGPEGR